MERRDFLKRSLMSAALMAVAPNMLLSAAENRSSRLHKGKNGGKNGGKMKLSWYKYDLTLAHTFTVSSFSRNTTPTVQVQIDYDGLVGYGEASMPPYLGHTQDSVCRFLEKVDLSPFSDPTQLDEILTYVDSLSEGDAPAKAAIDIALHDLAGKIMRQPIYRLLGLNPAKAPATSFTIGIDTPDVVREKTREALGKYRVLKVKVGRDTDREMIEAIRSVTDLPLVVDANQGWTDRQMALDQIYWLHEHGVQMAEQPMPVDRLDDIAWLTERSPIPIFADESVQRLKDVRHLRGVFSGINIKLMKCTGIREAWRMINYARTEGMRVMIGCMTETSCAVTAAAHLSPAVDFADLDGNLLITNDLYRGVTLDDGKLLLPNTSGLGLTPLK